MFDDLNTTLKERELLKEEQENFKDILDSTEDDFIERLSEGTDLDDDFDMDDEFEDSDDTDDSVDDGDTDVEDEELLDTDSDGF